MPETNANGGHAVTCPHCRREFDGRLIGAGGQRGFKCPHCRLFVPKERAAEEEPAEPAAPQA